MSRLFRVLLSATLLLGFSAPLLSADQTLDDIIDRLPADEIRGLGMVALALGYPDDAQSAKDQFRRSWWAFKPDVKLPKDRAEAAAAEFDQTIDGLQTLIQARGIRELKLAGVDRLAVASHQDWYFFGASPEGPVLVRISIGSTGSGGGRIFGIRTYTEWDAIKNAMAKVEFKLGKGVMSITYTPMKERKKPPTTNPALP